MRGRERENTAKALVLERLARLRVDLKGGGLHPATIRMLETLSSSAQPFYELFYIFFVRAEVHLKFYYNCM